MSQKLKYYIISEKAMSEVQLRTVEAKKLLSLGEVKTIKEAITKVGISRSAFYKYRDHINLLVDSSADKIVTIQASLDDNAGVLSRLLSLMAEFKVNILTINQTVPVDRVAIITVSVRTVGMRGEIGDLILSASTLQGVQKIEVIASE
ncbi:MAG: ACT domain-containing protein [Clostridiales bacterium]|nr:ACT domain-containing protein [Clostridiales bacterium]